MTAVTWMPGRGLRAGWNRRSTTTSAADGSGTSITVRPGSADADRARNAPAAETAARGSALSSLTNESMSAPAPSSERTPESLRSPSPTARPPQAAATSATEKDATPGLLLRRGRGGCRDRLGGSGRGRGGGLRGRRCGRSCDLRVEPRDDRLRQVDGLVVGEEQPRVELVENQGVALLARDLVDHRHDPLLELPELFSLRLLQLSLRVVLEALQVERFRLIVLLELLHRVLGQGLALVLDLLLHVPKLLLALLQVFLLGLLDLLDPGKALLADGGLLDDLLDLDHADLSCRRGRGRGLGGGASSENAEGEGAGRESDDAIHEWNSFVDIGPGGDAESTEAGIILDIARTSSRSRTRNPSGTRSGSRCPPGP